MRILVTTSRFLFVGALSVGAIAVFFACSSSNNNNTTVDSGTPENTGTTCANASQCYPGIDAGSLKGTVTCLTQLQNGYCSHTCTADTDCCAVPGECVSGFKQICAPLESSSQTYCVLSCETADVAAAPDAGTTDPTVYCQKFANPTFTCRSTGGGSNNKKFCGP